MRALRRSRPHEERLKPFSDFVLAAAQVTKQVGPAPQEKKAPGIGPRVTPSLPDPETGETDRRSGDKDQSCGPCVYERRRSADESGEPEQIPDEAAQAHVGCVDVAYDGEG